MKSGVSVEKMLWTLFFIPFAATCFSRLAGFVVTVAFVILHYTFKPHVMRHLKIYMPNQAAVTNVH